MKKLRFVELFAGIGGFSLGFERAGMECAGHVEIEPYARKVLLKHWPDVPLLEDVRNVKGTEFGAVDVICGGFPCQDLSVAGRQAGIGGARSGLFHEIIRIAAVCRPRWIILENVRNLLSKTEWMEIVLGEIAKIGYDAEWEVISARDIGAPHKRERIWIVAYPQEQPKRKQADEADPVTTGRQTRDESVHGSPPVADSQGGGHGGGSGEKRPEKGREVQPSEQGRDQVGSEAEGRGGFRGKGAMAHSIGTGLEGHSGNVPDGAGGPGQDGSTRPEGLREGTGEDRGAEPGLSGAAYGLSPWMDPDWEQGTPRVTTDSTNRKDRLKCIGNALVPQIAEYIGRQIIEAEQG